MNRTELMTKARAAADHRKITFQEEFLALLKKHRIEYDERYLWD